MNEINRYDYIRFTLTDIHGRSRGRVVPARHAQRCTQSGVSLYGGTVMFSLTNKLVPTSKHDPDCEKTPRAVLKPDMDTIYSVVWCGEKQFKVAEVICESFWLKDQTPQLACPRYVARQQLQRLGDHGFELLSGFEMEFMLLAKHSPLPSEPNYMSQREQAKYCDFFFEAEHNFYEAGVDIESFHCEYDAGSFEAVLKPLKGIEAVDAGIKFKNGIHEFADKGKYDITFENKPGRADLSMQFNHSLWSSSKNINVFQRKGGLSETGRHWLAGLLKHSRALTALFSPNMNCYERLNQPHRPGLIFWGHDERSACVKVKLHDTGKGVYLENRMPSAMSNPYLVLAGTVAAGLDGVVNRLECPPPGPNMADDNLPHTLSEAIEDLLSDTVMVKCLGKEFVDWFVATLQSDIDRPVELCLNEDEKSQCVIE